MLFGVSVSLRYKSARVNQSRDDAEFRRISNRKIKMSEEKGNRNVVCRCSSDVGGESNFSTNLHRMCSLFTASKTAVSRKIYDWRLLTDTNGGGTLLETVPGALEADPPYSRSKPDHCPRNWIESIDFVWPHKTKRKQRTSVRKLRPLK